MDVRKASEAIFYVMRTRVTAFTFKKGVR
jgi:hypothetical protein